MSKAKICCVTKDKEGCYVTMCDMVGTVKANIDCSVTGNNYIRIDTIEGSEQGYRYREKCGICIVSKGEEIFLGTFDELIDKLSK